MSDINEMNDNVDMNILKEENDVCDNNNSKLTTKRLIIFLAINFVITYFFEIFVMAKNSDGKNISQILLTYVGALVMMIPAFSVLLTRLITKEGFKNSSFVPSFKNGKYKYYLLAWFLPPVLIIAGAFLYFLIFRDDYSNSMEYIKAIYASRGTNLSSDELKKVAISQSLTSIFLSPLLNCINCFGEECGWRGYLLPKLREKMSTLKAILLCSVIWGVWHAPLIVMGHNYGTGYRFYPYGGIAAMCVFCIVVGIIFAYFTINSGSYIPAIIGHGALNGIASIGILFSKNGGNPFVGPSCVGIIGGMPLIIAAVYFLIKLLKEDKKISS